MKDLFKRLRHMDLSDKEREDLLFIAGGDEALAAYDVYLHDLETAQERHPQISNWAKIEVLAGE